ncbi:hypothetical protein ACFL4T_05570 [candidate division KSB1 bacterium]
MKSRLPVLLIGIFLIVLGGLIILDNLYYINFPEDYIASFVLVAIGIIFLAAYIQNTKRIWALVFCLFFVFLGASIFIAESYYLPDGIIGSILLFAVGSAFLAVYVKDRKNWWPVIPMGALYSIGLLVAFHEYFWRYQDYSSCILFFGMGLTFGYLYLIRNEENNLKWAKIPALILILFGLFIGLGQFLTFNEDLIFPSFLIAIGLVIILYHVFKGKKKPEDAVGMPEQSITEKSQAEQSLPDDIK